MDRRLDRARQEQEWGVPAILEACLTMAETDPAQGARLAAFLKDRPAPQIQPNIVPKISDQPWALGIFQAWEKGDVAGPVKAARSEEHTSELQSLMRISYAVFCLKKKKKNKT